MKVTFVRARAIDSGIFKEANCLSRHGHEVKLLVWDRQNDVRDENRSYKVDKFTMHAPYDKATVFLYHPFWYLYEFYYLLKDDSPIIHVSDLDTLWPAIMAKIFRKFKLNYTIYDFYANNIPELRPGFIGRFFRKAIAFVENAGIRFTDTLFLTDEARLEEVKDAKINKVVYIYNTPSDVYDASAMAPKSLKNGITIFYAGAILGSRGLNEMFKAIESLDGVRLIIAGKDTFGLIGKQSSSVRSKIEVLGWISHDEVLKRTQDADILFRFSDPSFPKSKYESPYKVFEAMMSAKPIIVTSGTLAARIVEENGCGVAIPYGDVDVIRATIARLGNDPGFRKTLGMNGRKAYEEKYSWKVMENRLLAAYGDETA